jgi:hypothetical protein
MTLILVNWQYQQTQQGISMTSLLRKALVIILASFLLLFAGEALAATYYVTQAGAGAANGSNCANAYSLATMNSSADDPDTYIICSSTPPEITSEINLVNSGTDNSNRITIQGEDANVTVTVSGDCIDLKDGEDWITFKDLILKDCSSNAIDGDSGGNDPENVGLRFDNVEVTYENSGSAYNSVQINDLDQYEILNSKFCTVPPNDTNQHDCVQLADASRGLFYGNTFSHAVHNSLKIIGDYESPNPYNVIVGNTFNNKYHNGLVIEKAAYPVLIENNYFDRIGYDAGNSPYTPGSAGFGPSLYVRGIGAKIVLRNRWFQPDAAIQLYPQTGTSVEKLFLLNNTMYDAKRRDNLKNVGTAHGFHGIFLVAQDDAVDPRSMVHDDVFKNNNFYLLEGSDKYLRFTQIDNRTGTPRHYSKPGR